MSYFFFLHLACHILVSRTIEHYRRSQRLEAILKVTTVYLAVSLSASYLEIGDLPFKVPREISVHVLEGQTEHVAPLIFTIRLADL